jgi:DNA-binding transcriptional regulator YdaS (Cro superfamily)
MSEVATQNNSVALLAELERAGAVIDNGLFLPADLAYETYESIGAMLGALHQASSFLVGDYLLYGEFTYGEKYTQAALLLGLSPQTLANYASIAKRVPPGRRKIGVSFSIHGEVASLPPELQEHWLTVAKNEQLTKQEIRDRLRPPKELPPAERSLVTCPHCKCSFWPDAL